MNFPNSDSPLLTDDDWYSRSQLDRNWLRLKPSELNTGELDYIGALPPGPAPPEGDWFTRLLDRWRPWLEEMDAEAIETDTSSQ